MPTHTLTTARERFRLLVLTGMNMHAALKVFSYVVLALMGAGIVYGAVIAVTYWSGISV